MKDYRSLIIIILILFSICTLPPAYAVETDATTTPVTEAQSEITNTPTKTAEDKSKQIEDLKSRLATKVAELRQTTKRAFYGTVKSKTVSTITIETKTKDIKIELTEGIKVAQVIKGSRTNLTTEDLEKDDTVSVFGDYDATLDLLTASYIFVENTSELVRINGTITSVNEDDFDFKLTGSDGAEYTVNYERTTKANSWSNSKAVTKIGFSNLAEGDMIYIVSLKDAKKPNELTAIRLLSLGNLTGAKATPETNPTEEATPSSSPKTNVSVNPTTKPTLKPTSKPTSKPTVSVTTAP